MDAQTTVTVRCTACGELGEVKPSCGCGAAFEYISPGELAAQAVKDNPGMSDRDLADKLGIGKDTIRRARTGANAPVEPRTGKDGKKRRMPRRGRRAADPAKQQQAAEMFLDEGLTREKVIEQTGLREFAIRQAVERELGRRGAIADPIIDPKTLPKTAQEKLAVALRQQQRAQRAEFEKRVAAEYTARVKKGFPELEKMERDARDTKRAYEQWLRESKKLGTSSDWNNLVMCLHPDTRRTASDEKFDRAFAWVQSRKFAITGEK